MAQWYQAGEQTKLPDAKAVENLSRLTASFFDDPDDLAWLMPIAEAIVMGKTFGHDHPDFAIREILKRTNKVKDRNFARQVLLPYLFAQRRKKRRPI